ncbi:MAG: autotransporter assembly complex protein TamA [Methylococcales bacterium]|nr:autotransporter assembly complex protein TamA [Methylococcales bacterium]
MRNPKRPLVLRINRWYLLLLLVLAVPGVFAEAIVSGVDGNVKDNVMVMMALDNETCATPEWKIRGLYDQADLEIDEALRALGYYHGVVKKSLVFDKSCWHAKIQIDKGPQVHIHDISITFDGIAQSDAAFQKLHKKLLKATGDPLDHSQYEKMKARIESFAQERGYLKGTFTEKKLIIDKKLNQAHIKLAFAAGKRMVFGKVVIEQDILDADFVEKYISINSGDFYTSEQLAKTHNDLSKSGYFDMVDIHPEAETDDHTVPVTIKLHPRKKHHYALGVGYDTDIGPLLSGAYENRRLNRRGHFLTSELDLSPILSTADIEYNIPLKNPISDFFSFGAGLKREDTDSFNTLSAKLSTRLKHALDSGWKQTLFLDLDYEDFTIGSVTTQTLLLVPGGSWYKSVSNKPMRPTKGYRAKIDVSGSYKNPISDVSFLQGAFSGTWMYPLPWRSKFIGRTELGATLVDDFDRLPTSYRFYAGGINSIRGYAYKELGPKDDQGNVIGGKFLTVLSFEYEKAVYGDWGVSVFLDTGDAFNPDDIKLKSGAGLGVRWYSPFGPVRVDFAVPLNDSDSSFQIHFAAGARI